MIYLYAAIMVAALLISCLLILACLSFKYAVSRKGIHISHALKGNSGPSTWLEFEDIIKEGTEWIQSQSLEDIVINSYDGLKLHAYYLPANAAKRTMLLMHGFRGNAFRDFSAALKYYHEHGCNLLMPDQRAHGKSEGRFICYGIKERFDCKCWCEYISSKMPSIPVYLDGISMGASTVLMASGLKLPKNVKGIIADCGFTSPRDIFSYVLKKTFHLPGFLLLPVFSLLCRVIAGFGTTEADTISALNVNKLPVLFAHGQQDTFVPYDCFLLGTL